MAIRDSFDVEAASVGLRCIAFLGSSLLALLVAMTSFYFFEQPVNQMTRNGCRKPAKGWAWPYSLLSSRTLRRPTYEGGATARHIAQAVLLGLIAHVSCISHRILLSASAFVTR